MRIQVKVKARANEQSIKKIDNHYVVQVKSPPDEGKANMELIQLIKSHFRASQVEIKSGFTSVYKILEVY